MIAKITTFAGLLAAAFITLGMAACTLPSANSYVSQEGVVGSLIGAATGTATGWLIGEEVGKKTENIALGAGIGGGLGLLSGALINEQNIKLARKREIVVREAALIGKNQRELDMLREQLYERSSFGGNEVKSWDRRYWGEDPAEPYQGPAPLTKSLGN